MSYLSWALTHPNLVLTVLELEKPLTWQKGVSPTFKFVWRADGLRLPSRSILSPNFFNSSRLSCWPRHPGAGSLVCPLQASSPENCTLAASGLVTRNRGSFTVPKLGAQCYIGVVHSAEDLAPWQLHGLLIVHRPCIYMVNERRGSFTDCSYFIYLKITFISR